MKPGTTQRPVDVDHLMAVVVAEPGDVPVDDGDVRVEPFAREHREHTTAADDDVRRLVATGHRQPA